MHKYIYVLKNIKVERRTPEVLAETARVRWTGEIEVGKERLEH